MGNKKDSIISKKLLGALIVSLLSVSVNAHAVPTKRPSLVVGIVVEGLNEDYITLLSNYLSEGGFHRLMRQGVTLSNVDYGPRIDSAAATAILYTGTSPSINGIPSKLVYDQERNHGVDILLDASKIGNFTDETYSPSAIQVSTLGDEVRVDAAGTGSVYSIAPEHHEAIIMSGHAGNSAFWINDVTGKWATTTYYKDMPQTVTMRNYQRPLENMLDTVVWNPMLPLPLYPDIPGYKVQYPFRHTYPRKDVDRYRAFKDSPAANREVTNMATDLISSLALGKHDAVDMLNLSYTVAPYLYTNDNDNRLETMDLYLRLDRDLERLFKTIDRQVGAGNALIFLAGTPAPMSSKRDDEKWGIPYGQFSPKRAISLLNMYLMALHDNGQWVSGYFNHNFYLNHKLIKEKNLDAAKVRAEAAEFLSRMSGVSNVFTIDDILANRAGDNASGLRRNTFLPHSGDLIVSINPGWETIDDSTVGSNFAPNVTREAYTPFPVYIMAPSVQPQIIDTPVDARAIAPTVARLLRIRSPNAAALPAIRL